MSAGRRGRSPWAGGAGGHHPPRSGDARIALGLALLSAIPLALLGEVLARALAIGRGQIHRLYAIDLSASAVAALAAIPLLHLVQGPFALALPALGCVLLSLMTGGFRGRSVVAAAAVTLLGLIGIAAQRDGPMLPMADAWVGRPLFERWNAYSRVRVSEHASGARELVIDRTASSIIPHVPRGSRGPPDIDPDWAGRYGDPSYALGRPVERVAIIGVGGGPDILPALAAGATDIVGFELNGRILELFFEDLQDFNAIALRPELRLIHDEARHALQYGAERYDVIRASLIDTWASTAAGGFVLSESSLYTVEAWRLFLGRLTPSGILATTRWYLPWAPAEAERLIALGAQALDDEGLAPAGDRLVVVSTPSKLEDPLVGGRIHLITTLVSRTPFGQSEVAALEAYARRVGGALLLAPHRAPAPAARGWQALLTPEARDSYVGKSRWAIDPPRDTRPFFFLQLRPADVFLPGPATEGPVSAITMNGVRVLVVTALAALIGVIVLLWWANKLAGDTDFSEAGTAWFRRVGHLYFACLGLGYMSVQLALHQRLSILLGHPTTTLALVVATMLLGTGIGSALSGYPPLRNAPRLTLAIPALAVAFLVGIAFPLIGRLSDAPTLIWTAVGAAALAGTMGVALGVALPTGMRLLAHHERAVAEAWAINGAFSVLGSALAALVGLMVGSRWLALLALPCYAVVWVVTYTVTPRMPAPSPTSTMP